MPALRILCQTLGTFPMPKLTIDGQEVEVPAGSTVLQACEAAGREIPVFCYHPRLNIAGNCRMCLVEMEKAPKPIASCAMPAADGMTIKTDSPTVHKARRGVLEMLLINHPLDCPICDQGGECDLQDITLFYGPDKSRFHENKRPVDDKYLGPLISTHMTRCIHCTRCIRFINEVAGVEELGATHRGEHMEITTWVGKALTSELSGNIIDLCPVGALNSAPYEYRARTWELKKTESVDVMDALGCNIRVDSRGPEVMRVVPRLSEEINEEWISDKTRFSYDGLRRRRLDRPFVERGGRLAPATWPEAFAAIKAALDGLKGEEIGFLIGDLVDCETMVLVKDLAAALGSPHVDCRVDGAPFQAGAPASWRFNSTVMGIDEADALLLVGVNPRLEAPVLNARIRKRYMTGKLKIARIGEAYDLTYPVSDLGGGGETLGRLTNGGLDFADVMKNAERPMLIVGAGAVNRPDGAAVLEALHGLADGFRPRQGRLERLQRPAHGGGARRRARTRADPGRGWRGCGRHPRCRARGKLEGAVPLRRRRDRLGAGSSASPSTRAATATAASRSPTSSCPAAAYTEKNATYVNVEGRPQRTRLSVFPPGEAKEDWKILRALSEALGRKVPLDNLAQVRARMAEIAPHLGCTDEVPATAEWSAFGSAGSIDKAPFASPIVDFYLTNPIARASTVMRECSRLFVKGEPMEATGTHG